MYKKAKPGKNCASKTCKNNTGNCKLSFFAFPNDIQRAKLWAIACGRKDFLENEKRMRYSRLCGAHFETRMFLNDLRNRLQPHAIPTRFSNVSDEQEQIEKVDLQMETSTTAINSEESTKYCKVTAERETMRIEGTDVQIQTSSTTSTPEEPTRYCEVTPEEEIVKIEEPILQIQANIMTSIPEKIIRNCKKDTPEEEPIGTEIADLQIPTGTNSTPVPEQNISSSVVCNSLILTINPTTPALETISRAETTGGNQLETNKGLEKADGERTESSIDSSEQLMVFIDRPNWSGTSNRKRRTFSHASTQTSNKLISNSPRILKLKKKIEFLRKDNLQLRNEIEFIHQRKCNIESITFEQYRLLTLKFSRSKDLANFNNTKVVQFT